MDGRSPTFNRGDGCAIYFSSIYFDTLNLHSLESLRSCEVHSLHACQLCLVHCHFSPNKASWTANHLTYIETQNMLKKCCGGHDRFYPAGRPGTSRSSRTSTSRASPVIVDRTGGWEIRGSPTFPGLNRGCKKVWDCLRKLQKCNKGVKISIWVCSVLTRLLGTVNLVTFPNHGRLFRP